MVLKKEIELLPVALLPLDPILSEIVPIALLEAAPLCQKSPCKSQSDLSDSDLGEENDSDSDVFLNSFSDCSISDDVCSDKSDSGKVITSTGAAECELFNSVLDEMCDDPASKVKEMAGKGIGMVALRKIYPGDLIFTEIPLFVMTGAVFDSGRDNTEEWLDKKINRLSSKQREVLLCLTDCRNASDNEQEDYVGMFYTNCMSYGDGDVCVCPVMARANHSCRPNAEFVSRVDLGKMELRAMYVIEAGEEVNINYLAMSEEGTEGRDVRREYLRRYYGFQCTCIACTMEDDELAVEEELREEIKQLQIRGADFWTPDEVSSFFDAMFKIQGKLSHMLTAIAIVCDATTNQPHKLEYCLQGLALALSIYGPHTKEAEEWRERLAPIQLWAQCRMIGHD